ncbi:MAG: DNA cytosine methyltransferase [Christensenellales bacterium]
MEQISLFDGNKKFVIDKPIRLISLFSGYDSQALALKYLGLEFEHYKTCEWAVKSIQALKDLHFENDNCDYSKGLNKEQVFDYLAKKCISANYNELMAYEQIKRLGEEKARVIYNNIKATHNLVNIQQVKGVDLEIKDTDKYCYIMTYSFPCQDLSLAGLGKGMEKGSGTRSSMLWEVERILEECAEGGRNHRFCLWKMSLRL